MRVFAFLVLFTVTGTGCVSWTQRTRTDTRNLNAGQRAETYVDEYCADVFMAVPIYCHAAYEGVSDSVAAAKTLGSESTPTQIERIAAALSESTANFWSSAIHGCSSQYFTCGWEPVLNVYRGGMKATGGAEALESACAGLAKHPTDNADREYRMALYDFCRIALEPKGSFNSYQTDIADARRRVDRAKTEMAFGAAKNAPAPVTTDTKPPDR